MNTYEMELIVDGKMLARFWTNNGNGKDAKFVANSLLNDRNRWTRMECPNGLWTKETQDGRTCYLDTVAIGIASE